MNINNFLVSSWLWRYPCSYYVITHEGVVDRKISPHPVSPEPMGVIRNCFPFWNFSFLFLFSENTIFDTFFMTGVQISELSRVVYIRLNAKFDRLKV